MDRVQKLEASLKKKDKKFIKSLIYVNLFTLVIIAIFSAQTYAYFSQSVMNPINKIDTGRFDMEIIELDNNDNGQDFDVSPIKMLPATSVSKKVSVKNTGTLPMYVRIKIEKSINKPENEMPSGWKELIDCNFKVDDIATPDVTEGLWVYHDGYYYYSTSLDAGITTSPLFDTVYFSADMGNQFENSEVSFKIVCQSTQTNGNSDDPITAGGWPPESSGATTVAEGAEQGSAAELNN